MPVAHQRACACILWRIKCAPAPAGPPVPRAAGTRGRPLPAGWLRAQTRRRSPRGSPRLRQRSQRPCDDVGRCRAHVRLAAGPRAQGVVAARDRPRAPPPVDDRRDPRLPRRALGDGRARGLGGLRLLRGHMRRAVRKAVRGGAYGGARRGASVIECQAGPLVPRPPAAGRRPRPLVPLAVTQLLRRHPRRSRTTQAARRPPRSSSLRPQERVRRAAATLVGRKAPADGGDPVSEGCTGRRLAIEPPSRPR